MILEVTNYSGDENYADCVLPINFGEVLHYYETGTNITLHINYLNRQIYHDLFSAPFVIIKTTENEYAMLGLDINHNTFDYYYGDVYIMTLNSPV